MCVAAAKAVIGLRVVLAPQVSEHASWSTQYYGRIISAALAAVGALHIAAPGIHDMESKAQSAEMPQGDRIISLVVVAVDLQRAEMSPNDQARRRVWSRS